MSKTYDKNLTEMNTTELREIIGALQTELSRVHTKNKRRRKALKEMNRNALVNFKLRGDLQGEVRYLRQSVRILTDTLEHHRRTGKEFVDKIAKGEKVQAGNVTFEPTRTHKGFFSRLLGRGVKGVTGA